MVSSLVMLVYFLVLFEPLSIIGLCLWKSLRKEGTSDLQRSYLGALFASVSHLWKKIVLLFIFLIVLDLVSLWGLCAVQSIRGAGDFGSLLFSDVFLLVMWTGYPFSPSPSKHALFSSGWSQAAGLHAALCDWDSSVCVMRRPDCWA